jgi:hypothetical protein
MPTGLPEDVYCCDSRLRLRLLYKAVAPRFTGVHDRSGEPKGTIA